MIKGLCIPYTGSKAGIADKICNCFPKADNFYDLFAGGFAITSFMLANKYNKYKNFYANDIKPGTNELFKRAITGEFNESKFRPKWISKKEFDEKKNVDPYIACCWSFGNSCKSYMFNSGIEGYKKSMHNAVVFGEFDDLASEVLKKDKWPSSINSIYKRRLYLRRLIEYYRIKNCLPKCLYKYLSEEQLKLIKKIDHLKRLQRLQQLERLQKLQQLEQLERLQKLQQLEQLERLPIPKLSTTNVSYDQVEIKPNAVVYCDPPYKDTFDYQTKFSTERFLDWADSLKEIVFISEYNINDKRFTLFVSNKKRQTFRSDAKKTMQEKLYINRYGRQKLMS